jgi:hypothetical protein
MGMPHEVDGKAGYQVGSGVSFGLRDELAEEGKGGREVRREEGRKGGREEGRKGGREEERKSEREEERKGGREDGRKRRKGGREDERKEQKKKKINGNTFKTFFNFKNFA